MFLYRCYLAGALRDASVKVRCCRDYEVTVAQNDFSWLQVINEMIEDLYGFSGRIYVEKRGSRSYFVLRFFSKMLVKRLQEDYGLTGTQYDWPTPKFILRTKGQECIKKYIQGFFDAEGGLPKNPVKNKQLYLSFDQKMREPLEFLREKLIQQGYTPTHITFTHGTHQFRLTRVKDILKFIREINSLHPEKKNRMNLILTLYSKHMLLKTKKSEPCPP